eukprot:9504120-Pyramimonas_sp.AAC.4
MTEPPPTVRWLTRWSTRSADSGDLSAARGCPSMRPCCSASPRGGGPPRRSPGPMSLAAARSMPSNGPVSVPDLPTIHCRSLWPKSFWPPHHLRRELPQSWPP